MRRQAKKEIKQTSVNTWTTNSLQQDVIQQAYVLANPAKGKEMGTETLKTFTENYPKASGLTAPCLNNDLELTPRDIEEYI